MKEIESTQTKMFATALRTTEEILEELIRGTKEVKYTKSILHSFPRNEFVPQQSETIRNTYNPDKYSMYQRPERESKASRAPIVEVRKSKEGKIPIVVFSNVSEFQAETVAKQQWQGKEVLCPSTDADVEFKQPCRVCREERNVKAMNSIFSENRQYENLPFILKTLVEIEVELDTEQPALICAVCLDTLTIFFNFYQKVKVAQYISKSTMKSAKDSVEDNSLIIPVSTVKVAPVKLSRHLKEKPNSIVSPRVKKAQEMLSKSSFLHFVNRKITDEKWENIYDAMISYDGNGCNLKELEDCILYHPFAENWHCIDCKKIIPGDGAKFIDHSIQAHEAAAPDQVMFPCDVCGIAFPLMSSEGIDESYCEHWLNHFFTKECAVCQRKFISHFAMRKHKESFHAESLFECDRCEKVFVSESILKLHKNEDHAPLIEKQKKRLAWCKLCKKSVTGLWLHNAKRHFEETAWKCEDCDKKFLTRSHLKSHRSRVHPDIKTRSSFKCTVCEQSFSCLTARTRHCYEVHSAHKYFCEICQKSFLRSNGLRKHLLTHQSTGDCVCEVCGKSMKGKSHLKEHMNIHNDEKPFECPICGVKIRMKSNLWKHMKTAHKTTMKAYRESIANIPSTAMESDNIRSDVVCTEKNQSLKCDDCGKLFETVEILEAHRDLVHSELTISRVEVWKCDYCDECFDSAAVKGKHVEEKHEEKIEGSTICTLCNKKYTNVISYKSHMRKVHSNRKVTVEVPCEICGRVLKSKEILKVHIRNAHILTTNSVPCPLCPWKFRREDLVKSHMRSTHKVSMAEYRKSLASVNSTSGAQK